MITLEEIKTITKAAQEAELKRIEEERIAKKKAEDERNAHRIGQAQRNITFHTNEASKLITEAAKQGKTTCDYQLGPYDEYRISITLPGVMENLKQFSPKTYTQVVDVQIRAPGARNEPDYETYHFISFNWA